MKHVYAFLIQFLMVCLLCSCSGYTSELKPAAVEEPAVSTEPEPVQTPVIETVSLYGRSVQTDIKELNIDKPVDSLEELKNALPELSSLQTLRLVLPMSFSADGKAFEDEFDDLCLQNPDITFSVTWLLDGELPESYTAYAAKPEDEPAFDNLSRMIAKLHNLTSLDLTAINPTRESIAALLQTMPNIQILWNDPTFGASDSNAERLAFSTASVNDLGSYLPCFRKLIEVDLLEADISEPETDQLCRAFPDLAFHRMVTLNGIPFDSFLEELNLDHAAIQDYDTFSERLGFFPHLKRIELNECSLSNDQLESLSRIYPAVKVVWTVHIRKYAIRTDSVAFSTQQPGDNKNRLTSNDLSPLRYCTDLIALDLGHNDVSDLEFLRPLQNLQVLILADSRRIKDITVLGSLKKLKYIELFMTGVSDITPLADLPDLLDINLCITRVTDPTPLTACKKLERIWIGHQTLAYMEEEKLRILMEEFPDAEYDITSVSCTNLGWREHPRFFAFRSMFRDNEPVAPFLP